MRVTVCYNAANIDINSAFELLKNKQFWRNKKSKYLL